MVISRGECAEPVSMSLTVLVDTPDRSARASCESRAAERKERRRSPRDRFTPAGPDRKCVILRGPALDRDG